MNTETIERQIPDDDIGGSEGADPTSDFDNGVASAEGWAIFECGGSANGIYQLCRCDEEAIFPDDDAAWAHVVKKVAEGSTYHRSALDYIRAHNTIEWASFAKVHGEPLVHANGKSMLDANYALVDDTGRQIIRDRKPLRFPPDPNPRPDPPDQSEHAAHEAVEKT